MNFYISYFYLKKTCFFFLSHLASNNSRKTMSGLFAVKHSCEAPFFASDHVIKKKKKSLQAQTKVSRGHGNTFARLN